MKDINDTLADALKAKDVPAIRNTLVTFIMQDPGFSAGNTFEKKVQEAQAELKRQGSELFEPYDGGALIDNEAEWTKDYFSVQKTEFRDNFSKERFDHLKKVGQKLFPPKKENTPVQEQAAEKKNQETGSGSNGAVKIGVIAGAGVGVVAGVGAGIGAGVIAGVIAGVGAVLLWKNIFKK